MSPALPRALAPLTVPRDALHPPSADNAGFGLGMSLVAHALLVTALAVGVRWRTETPEAVSAELWAATPQIAAAPRAEPLPAPAPEPAPPPAREAAPPPAPAEREADIATARAERLQREKAQRDDEARQAREKAQKERQEKERLDKERAEKDKLEARRQAEAQERAAEAQREKLHQDQLRRMQQQLGGAVGNGAPGSTGTAAREAGPSAGYAGRIKARIKPNIVLTDEVAGNPLAEVEVKVAPDGSILSRRIVTPSGSRLWDEAVLRAIDRTQVLPRDTDGRVPPTLIIAFKPND